QASLDFEAVYFLADPDYNRFMDTQQAILLALMGALEREGIRLAQPDRVLRLAAEAEAPLLRRPSEQPADPSLRREGRRVAHAAARSRREKGADPCASPPDSPAPAPHTPRRARGSQSSPPPSLPPRRSPRSPPPPRPRPARRACCATPTSTAARSPSSTPATS